MGLIGTDEGIGCGGGERGRVHRRERREQRVTGWREGVLNGAMGLRWRRCRVQGTDWNVTGRAHWIQRLSRK